MAVRATRVRRLRIRHAVETTTAVVAILVATSFWFAVQKHVTLVVDGRPESVRTTSSNVAELLEAQGIRLTSGVVIMPSPATPVADGMTVVVDRPASGSQVLEGPDVGVWVVDGTSGIRAKVAAMLAEAKASVPGVWATPVVAARAVVVGKVHDVLTNATTAGELLSAMGIRPDASDRVQPPPSTPLHPGMTVTFDRVRIATRRIRVQIPFTSATTYSSVLAPGQVRVISRGADGLMSERVRVKVVNGKVVRRGLLSRRVVRAATPEIRQIGSSSSGTHGTQIGEASWYDTTGAGFTAASPWLPFGTRVTVTDLATGESITVVIDDRGPFGGRIIDLSPEAFSALAPLGRGVLQVRLGW